jgi:hypothetical protein
LKAPIDFDHGRSSAVSALLARLTDVAIVFGIGVEG